MDDAPQTAPHPGYIVIDTETNKLATFKKPDGTPHPADADDQPRLAELAIVYLDENFKIEREFVRYVRPNGWKMEPEAAAKNGLTDEFLNEHGREVTEVLPEYQNAIEKGRSVLAYGAQFDCKILRGELRRAGLDDLFERTFNACVMQSCMALKMPKYDDAGEPIPNARGWPRLSDACRFFGIEQEKAHSGLSDARAAAEIAKRLHESGHLKKPAVHYAKNHPGNSTS